MRISDVQRAMLQTTSSKKVTAAELGELVGQRPGPAARAADSLVKQGLFNVTVRRDEKKLYNRSASGAAVARTFK